MSNRTIRDDPRSESRWLADPRWRDDPLRAALVHFRHQSVVANARLMIATANGADQELEVLLDDLEQAVNLAEHLFQMVDRETWLATGGDDGQGHYEGDYRAAGVAEEIRALRRALEGRRPAVEQSGRV